MPKTYTSVPSVSTGDVYQAATYNTYTAQNLNNLIVPPMVKATRSASTSYTSGNALTWPTEAYDTDDMHDTSTNTSRLTINTAGVYVLHAAFFITFGGTLTFATPTFTKNGSTVFVTYVNNMNGSVNFRFDISHVESCAVGDYLEVSVGLSGATSPQQSFNAFDSYFSATWIGRTS